MEKLSDKKVNNIKNKEINTIKIGRITFGITLIIIGIVVLFQTILKVNIIKYVIMSWPVILIILGIETLCFSRKDNINIKYDALGIILTFLVLFAASVLSLVTYGIDKITSYQTSEIVNEMIDNNYTRSFENKIEIINLTEGNVNVKKQINSDFSGTHVICNVTYKEDFKPNIISALNNYYSVYHMLNVDKTDENISKISIIHMPDYVESIDFIITSQNEDNIKLSGNILL